jgi:hypothetical protein
MGDIQIPDKTGGRAPGEEISKKMPLAFCQRHFI